jgi:hypothetical protein
MTIGNVTPDIRNVPDETQLIASFLLGFVERYIVDANCFKDYELEEDYEEPFLIEHEESKQFKKSLTHFLRAYINDDSVPLEERIQKDIDNVVRAKLTEVEELENQVEEPKKQVEVHQRIENARREMENEMTRLDTEIGKLTEMKMKKKREFESIQFIQLVAIRHQLLTKRRRWRWI